MLSKEVDDEPLQSIIANSRRLIADAEILLRRGSAGSALSLAIMAFEEAGKGFSHELDLRKTKGIRSSHQFRHIVAAMHLSVSMHQKHGLKRPTLSDEAENVLRDRIGAARTFTEFAREPPPELYRKEAGTAIFKQVSSLPKEQQIVAITEIRWLRKVLMAAARGEIEQFRQKGLYVDFDEHDLLSRPSDVTRAEAYQWIWNAKRAVNLLAFGLYFQPYTELSAFLESLPRPWEDDETLSTAFANLQEAAAKFDGATEECSDSASDTPIEPYPPWKGTPAKADQTSDSE